MIAHTLRGEGFDASEDGTGRGTPLVPVAFSIMPMNSGKDYKARETDIAQPLMAGGPVGGNQGGDYIAQPMAYGIEIGPSGGIFTNCNPTLDARAKDGPIRNQLSGAVMTSTMQVRRLTLVECERLQGFPDSYTDIQPNGKPTPDGPRYKALGNSMAVPVMRWIGQRIQRVESPEWLR